MQIYAAILALVVFAATFGQGSISVAAEWGGKFLPAAMMRMNRPRFPKRAP